MTATSRKGNCARAGGVRALIVVALNTCTLLAARPATRTLAPGKKPLPVIVSSVPPAAGPLLGVTASTRGAGSPAGTSVIFNPKPYWLEPRGQRPNCRTATLATKV